MKRCNKCIMPVSAKGIKLDGNGECQLCSGFKQYIPKGEQELRKTIEPYIRGKKGPNCIVPVSGGRDSSYALYYAVKVLGLKPLAVHNDNDFETPVANRNLEVISQRLDVPLIRVSSKDQLTKKIVAEKFKMNAPFGPHLVVDQTCEACQIGFESAAYNVARKKGIELVIWADSKDESTSSFHKLFHHETPSTFERLLSPHALHMLSYKYYTLRLKQEYGPHSPHGLKEIHFYDYILWDQNVIVETIQKQLGWAVPDGSPTTWRVDCSLVPVVNYLTEKAYGVSKIELGFSNMVRSGKMDREDALSRVEQIKKNLDVQQLKSFLREIGIAAATVDRVMN